MSLLHLLLYTVVVGCVAPLCAAQWPCPDSSDIVPCVCSATADYEITMDCSNVISSDQLGVVFQTPFAFNDFKRLIIEPVDPFESLLVLPGGVFGPVNFQEIDITNTFIHTVEEQALVNSHSTLQRLNMGGNEISNFPLETLDLFTSLREFDLSYNKMSGLMPDIVSETILRLDFSGNTGFTLTETAFVGAAVLEELRLNSMGLANTTPPNVFLTNKYLRTLYLESNSISGTLIEDFINPELKPLITVHLNGNSIAQIHPLAITGMKTEGTISFRYNQIEYLSQEDWGGLVSQLASPDAIDMRDNPLVCGCDMMWLVFDADLMKIFHNETKCVTGNYIIDLPQQWFLEHCP